MKNIFFVSIITSILVFGCASNAPLTKSKAYKGIYIEKPLTVLLMPPINRSTNVEAKEYFYSTLNVPIDNAGFYVIPPFLSMAILEKESAYDAELFINAPLTKFKDVFGADMVLFTIINRWDKSSIAANVDVAVEYILKSTKTNDVIYRRKGEVTYDASISTGYSGLIGALADIAASAINTAATKYVDVARVCNTYTFKDLPAGKYNPSYGKDGQELAGKNNFKKRLNSKYH